MADRKLAHIERVVKIEPIPNADKIEKVTVLGWECVCHKGEVKEGDYIVYIEIDSIVPPIPYFEFMKDRHYRVKTIKLRKQISQGLIIPIKNLPQIWNKRIDLGCIKEGEDVTDSLGIKKYESLSDKESNEGTPKKKHSWFIRHMTRYQWFRKMFHIKSKSFPTWISKTDEERIQNIPWVLTKYKDAPFYATEKLDGQSATYWYKHGLFPEFGICSRTVRKSELNNSNWSKVAKQFNIKNILKNDYRDLCIQGEIIGEGIQGNHYNIKGYDFYIFNIYNIKTKKYFSYGQLLEWCNYNKLKMVPYTEGQLYSTVAEMVECAKGNSTLINKKREGIVLRSYDQSISFKVINPEYLLENGD